MNREYQSELWLPLPPEALFPFFSDAGNLEQITPPWLHFRVLTPKPIEMKEGALIDYRLKVHGLPMKWRTRINCWDPPHRFEDEQLRGPYRKWVHEHTFEERDGGTVVRDRVEYATPFDWLVHGILVRPDIERIFDYRTKALRKRFDEQDR
mgnify:CR=1 FL=1